MQQKKDVNLEVLKLLREQSNEKAFSPKEWRRAYSIVRAKAIADTVMWKQNNITIERC